MNAPATLGRGLGRSLALATVIGMLVFGVVNVLVIYITELGERCEAVGVLEDPPLEIVEQCSIAFAFALPFGVVLALMLARRLTHETTDRLDEVISSAKRMTGERLDERLPVSPAADPLDRLSTAINDMLQRIEVGVKAQSQFAADASHELRTPLTVISTNLEVARRKPREPSHWEHVADDTLGEVQRMAQLVDKLLVLSRAGSAGLKHAPAELRTIAAGAVERTEVLAEKLGVRVELADGPEVTADLDADAIAIVIDNLIRNALEFSPKGEAVVVRVGPAAELSVEDHGPGVNEDERERIFEPFARGTRPADRAAGTGLGLGLAICKRIVEGHGGTITVGDRPGGGAQFDVKLPERE